MFKNYYQFLSRKRKSKVGNSVNTQYEALKIFLELMAGCFEIPIERFYLYQYQKVYNY